MSKVEKLLVLYVPSLDRRLVNADAAPFLHERMRQHPQIELETHPSVELLPSLVTGVWPHQHRIWQVRLRPEARRTALQHVVDSLPNAWTTTCQCLWHRFHPGFDLPTIEPRRRRRFEMHRIKVQRRFGGGDTHSLHEHGLASIFSVLNGSSQYRTLFSFTDVPDDPNQLVTGERALDFLELYAFDLFCHWNLDRLDEVRARLKTLDSIIQRLCGHAERLGIHTLLVVDHGQEPVRHTIDLQRILAKTGVPDDEYLFYIEVCNARFWFFTERARQVSSERLARVERAAFLTNADMSRYHVHFRDSDGFGDAYLISDPGAIFFPHDFYHPLVNWYMGRKTPEQKSRLRSPVHRGYHGHLPGQVPDTGYLMALTADLVPATDKGQLIDFAPTVLHLLGRPVPAQMQGHKLFR